MSKGSYGTFLYRYHALGLSVTDIIHTVHLQLVSGLHTLAVKSLATWGRRTKSCDIPLYNMEQIIYKYWSSFDFFTKLWFLHNSTRGTSELGTVFKKLITNVITFAIISNASCSKDNRIRTVQLNNAEARNEVFAMIFFCFCLVCRFTQLNTCTSVSVIQHYTI